MQSGRKLQTAKSGYEIVKTDQMSLTNYVLGVRYLPESYAPESEVQVAYDETEVHTRHRGH